MNRKLKIAYLMARDIYWVKSDLYNNDWSFLFQILDGSWFKQYSYLSDKEIDELFKDFLGLYSEDEVDLALDQYVKEGNTDHPKEYIKEVLHNLEENETEE